MFLIRALFTVQYDPQPAERAFISRLVRREDNGLAVGAAVLDNQESERFFGVPLARRGMQPVWLQIRNKSDRPYRLRLASIDPAYFPPLEAALLNHFGIGKRILAFGALAWLFLPMLLLIPFKVIGARRANRRMNAYFQEHGIGWGLIRPGEELSGFVFTALDEGTKQFCVKLISTSDTRDFPFAIPIPGLKVDHATKQFEQLVQPMETVECDEAKLRQRLAALPRSTGNKRSTREGDPLNLVAIGSFEAILNSFGARWDETETITAESCWRTFKAFALGSSYRYSPVSSLFFAGRSQDFALQKARQTINQRLHLRLWLTELRFQGKPVWIGQVSRDIGVRFTFRTWNLTTHKIDPDVDDARDYVMNDLLEAGRVEQIGYVSGVEEAPRAHPRRNLTGDPYFTDGFRAVLMFAEERTTARFLNWLTET